MSAHIEHRHVQKHDLPRRPAAPQIFCKGELFIRSTLEMIIQGKDVDRSQVERIPTLRCRQVKIGQVIRPVLFVVPDGGQQRHVIDRLCRAGLEKTLATTRL